MLPQANASPQVSPLPFPASLTSSFPTHCLLSSSLRNTIVGRRGAREDDQKLGLQERLTLVASRPQNADRRRWPTLKYRPTLDY